MLCDEIEGSLACLDHMFRVIELDPGYASALNYIGYTYVEKGVNYKEAEIFLTRALEVSPDSGHIIDSLGWLYYRKGELEKAVHELEKASKHLPNDPVVTKHLADAYLKQSKKTKAFELYEKAFRLDPENSEIGDKLNKLKEELNQ